MKIDYDNGQFVFLGNGTWPDYVGSLEKKNVHFLQTDIGFVTCKKSDDGRMKLFRYYRLAGWPSVDQSINSR